jgi:glutathione S-transferase
LVDGETTVRDAQAILTYLARRYGGEDWFPSDAIAASQMVRLVVNHSRRSAPKVQKMLVFTTYLVLKALISIAQQKKQKTS